MTKAAAPGGVLPPIPGALTGRKLTFTMIDPRRAIPNPENPRTIAPEARAALKKGLETLGWVEPICLRAEDRMILGGHQRRDIAVELKYKRIPAVLVHDLTDAEAEAINIALNNERAQGAWDFEKLTGSLGRLKAQDFDLTLSGFDLKEATRLLSGGTLTSLQPGPQLDPGAQGRYKEQYGVIVICDDAKQQETIFNRLTGEGLTCRVVVT